MPVSPWISTVLFIGETSSSVANSRFISGLPPTRLPNWNFSLSRAAQLRVLALEPPLADRRLHDLHELDELERLDQEIDRAALQRAHGLIDAPEPGGDDAPHVRVAGERLVEDVEAVAPLSWTSTTRPS